jgi:hypothetical protein
MQNNLIKISEVPFLDRHQKPLVPDFYLSREGELVYIQPSSKGWQYTSLDSKHFELIPEMAAQFRRIENLENYLARFDVEKSFILEYQRKSI